MLFMASVISPEEAVCLAGIPDLLDVKNPSRGPLGAPDPDVVSAIRCAIGPTEQLSAALGDIDRDIEKTMETARALALAGAGILKAGLADICAESAVEGLRAIKKSLPQGTLLVAAAYADADELGFLSPFQLAGLAGEAKADGILVDTFGKDGRSLLDFFGVDELALIVGQAREFGLMTALAGALGPDDIAGLAPACPDWLGFRSAITTDGKRGDVGVNLRKAIELKARLPESKLSGLRV